MQWDGLLHPNNWAKCDEATGFSLLNLFVFCVAEPLKFLSATLEHMQYISASPIWPALCLSSADAPQP